ncbi:MAG: hypothetical protein LBR77_08690 [Lachnospiraceae bacterium]|jgi:CRISPR type III-A/MTUBE-associated protein Csm6|nr:hypothetical protein [Lachnospiraceae bacterium]
MSVDKSGKPYVLFTGVGDTDPVRDAYDGPILHIVRHFAPQKVYLFLTGEMSRRDRANDLYQRAIRRVRPGTDVVKEYTDIERANDFDEFHERYHALLERIHGENPEAVILLNVSSGTPQMKNALCLEYVSGDLPMEVVQVSHPEKKSGANTKHFDPDRDDLDEALEYSFDNPAAYDGAEMRCSHPDLRCYKKSIAKEQIKAMVGKYDYMGAYERVREISENFPGLFAPEVQALVSHAYHRSLPEPEEAIKAAHGLGMFPALYPYPTDKGRNENAQDITEYYLLTKIKGERKELSDFVIRLKNMAEFLAREYVEAHAGWAIRWEGAAGPLASGGRQAAGPHVSVGRQAAGSGASGGRQLSTGASASAASSGGEAGQPSDGRTPFVMKLRNKDECRFVEDAVTGSLRQALDNENYRMQRGAYLFGGSINLGAWVVVLEELFPDRKDVTGAFREIYGVVTGQKTDIGGGRKGDGNRGRTGGREDGANRAVSSRNQVAHTITPFTEKDLAATGQTVKGICGKCEKILKATYGRQVPSEAFGIYETINQKIRDAVELPGGAG